MEWTNWLFIAFALIVGVIYTILFIRNRLPFQLCLSIWAFSTLLQYVSNNHTFLTVLSILQILLAMVTFYFLFASKKARMNKLYKKLAQHSAQNLPPEGLEGEQSSEQSPSEQPPSEQPTTEDK
ncbi:MAG: hypothetical protein RR497_04320 [Oscillospiraceae bacterium]